MKRSLPLLLLFTSLGVQAGTISLPAESGSPLYVDEWSIPNYRCYFAPNQGASVHDGSDRCALLFPVALDAGRKLYRVRALYEDDDLVSAFSMQVVSRSLVTGANTAIVALSDDQAGPVALESMWLVPDHWITGTAAVYVSVEIAGNTRLRAISYEWK